MHVEMFRRSVQQRAWCTDPNYIFNELESYWSQFWNCEQRVNLSSAQYLVEGLPEIAPFDAHVSCEDVVNAIKGLKPGKARGLDGFSNVELQCFSQSECALLAEIFNSIVETGVWPEELCAGVVSLLAKVPEPATAKDGRPITILPSLYRLFGKIFTQKIFLHWKGYLPESLYGSVPGKSSTDAAWELASAIEEALSKKQDLFGVSLDLSKAYNTIQRNVLQAFALRCGWPAKLASAYVGYLDKLQRFFRIQGGVYGPVTSAIGVPEGCPLAVPAMILLTWAVTQQVACHDCCLTSYVDNWTVQTPLGHQVPQVLGTICQAADCLHLRLNPDKTRAYATSAEGRQRLRSVTVQGFPLSVLLRIDDLGVDFNVSRQQVAATVLRRLELNQPKLQRLQVLPWAADRKAMVLSRVIQPAIFFGCELSAVSLSTFSTIRGKFSSAIWGKSNQRNHFIAPLLSSSVVYEPFVHVFIRRVAALQRAFAANPTTVQRRWDEVLGCTQRVSGPFSYLLQQILDIGWVPASGLVCVDQAGERLHLGFCSKQHLRSSALNSWWFVISTKLPSQPGLQDVSEVNLVHTLSLRHHAKVKATVTGCFSAGAALFSSQKKHFLPDAASNCRHCGREDSQIHRLQKCSFYEYARGHLPANFFDQVTQPELVRGLFRLPPAVKECKDWLLNFPFPKTGKFFDEHTLLFTDGSTDPHAVQPLSGWAVVLAESRTSWENAVVESGPLPGLQCNYRAELFACLAALQSADEGCIFCDNFAVVCGLRVLILQGWVHSRWLRNAATDLWWQVWVTLAPMRHKWQIHHVKSHRDWRVVTGDFDRWTAFHNAAADKAAKDARNKWPEHALTLVREARRAGDLQIALAKNVFHLQKQVMCGRKLGADQSISRVAASLPPASSVLDLSRAPVLNFDWPTLDMQDALLNPRFMTVLYDFLQNCELVSVPSWVSLFEVYLFFVKRSGWVTPVNIAKMPQSMLPPKLRTCKVPSAWVHETEYQELRLCRPPLGSQLRVFLHALKALSARAKLDLKFHREKSLKHAGIFEPVPSMQVAPKELREIRPQVHTLCDGGFSKAMKGFFSPSTQAAECAIPAVHPTLVWNQYIRSQRAKRANS